MYIYLFIDLFVYLVVYFLLIFYVYIYLLTSLFIHLLVHVISYLFITFRVYFYALDVKHRSADLTETSVTSKVIPQGYIFRVLLLGAGKRLRMMAMEESLQTQEAGVAKTSCSSRAICQQPLGEVALV